MSYIGRQGGLATRNVYKFVPTSSGTTLSGQDSFGRVLSMPSAVDLIDVYLNGVLLIGRSTDYSVTKTTLTFTSAYAANDEIIIVTTEPFAVADMVKASTGGTFSGAVNVTTGSSGASANSVVDDLVVQGSGRSGISILTPDANDGQLVFGSPSDNIGAFISYKHSTARMDIGTSLSGASLYLTSGDGATAMTLDADGIITKPLQPLFEVTTSTTQNISSATLTKTTLWDTKIHDQNSDFDISTDQFTAPVAGTYLMTCALTYETMVAGAGHGIVWKKQSSGGSMDFYKNAYHQATEINITHMMIATTIMTLSASDKIELHVFQGSGATRTLQANNVFTSANSMSNNWQGFLIG